MVTEVEEKAEMMVCGEGGGVVKVSVPLVRQREAVLQPDQVSRIGRLLQDLEERLGTPQDFEWAFEGGVYVHCMCMYRCVCVGSVVSVWMCDALTHLYMHMHSVHI